MFKRLLGGLIVALLAFTVMTAQVSVPNTFVPGTTIQSSKINQNFAVLADALNRTGGAITGNITVSPGVTIDGVDVGTLSDAALKAAGNTFSGANTFSSTNTFSGVATFTASPMVSTAAPTLYWYESDEALNGKRWYLGASAGVFYLGAANDDNSGQVQYINLTRSSTTINFLQAAVYSALATFNAGLTTAAASPFLYFTETDQATDAKTWKANVDGGAWKLQTVSDALAVQTTPLSIDRTTGVPTFSAGIRERARTTALGEWTSVAFSAGNFTASAGTWTLVAGDQVDLSYTLIGKTMTVNFDLETTSVSATPQELRFPIPASMTANRAAMNTFFYNDGSTTQTAVGVVSVASGATTVVLRRFTAGLATWSTSTDATLLRGQITFEVQ